VSWATTEVTLRLRSRATLLTGAGLVAVMLMVGALYPAVGTTIGKLDLPPSVANLLGGADYGTITGWFRSEIATIYAPLVVGALAVTTATAATAGEEESGILALVLAQPVRRAQLLTTKALAVAAVVLVIAVAVWVGLIAGVAVGGGGIGLSHMTALGVQLAFFGFATGALALALAAGTGRRSIGNGGAAAIIVLGWLVNSFAPLVSGIAWLRYLSLFYYYAGHDPLGRGVGVSGLVVLGLVSVALTTAAVFAFERRDLRG
jgi:ABC-2 type transport system permease protein